MLLLEFGILSELVRNSSSSNSSSRSSGSSRVGASCPATILAQDSAALSFAPPSPPFNYASAPRTPGAMTYVFEAKFEGLVQDSKCPTSFCDWLGKQKLLDIESFGSAAASEILLKTDVTDVAKSDGVDFKNIGESSTVSTLWRACRRALPEGAQAAAVRGAMPDPASCLSEGTEKGIKEKWSKRHSWIVSDSLLLIRPLQAKLHKELTSVPPNMGVYAMEQLRTMACLETKTATLLQIEPGEAVKGVEIAADSVAGHWQVYIRVRAFFFTCAYVCVADPSMFDLQTANAASEKVLSFLQHTYSVRYPPVSFFVLAWTQTCHRISEALRIRDNPKLKSIVLDGSLWESHWTSYIPTQNGSGGSKGQADTSP